MKFNKFVVFLNIFFLFLAFESFSEEQSSPKLGQFDNWSAYAKNRVYCYMISEPHKLEGEYNMRGRVRIVVYRNTEEKNNKNLVGIDFGYSFPDEGKALIKIDNKSEFELSTFKQTAWTGASTKTDKEIINQMKKGNKLIALGKSKRGTDTKDTYSLKGFSKAFKKIENYCR